MKKITLIIFSILLFTMGCEKKDEITNPILSESSVTIQEGETKEIKISGGQAPYMVQTIPEGVAITSISNSTLSITGTKTGNTIATIKGSDGGNAKLSITVTADPFSAFKADETPRWEFPDGKVVIRSDKNKHVFITDKGKLFGSGQQKWGYASLDGTKFCLIEWGTAPIMRTETGTVAVADFKTVYTKAEKVWLIFKVNNSEHRVVAQ
ncbi:MAG: hypothetical protein LBD75_04640 [Candidatus Peribacteria bacterium]|jgi:hypothetical protein|nr:hypothetical protein [Candidatus Peribacteria bacterium]